MSNKKDKTLYYRRAVWYHDVRLAALCYVPAGYYELNVATEPTIVIPENALVGLVTELDELGYIKPRLDERLRTEDLKITHRLLDLLDQAVGALDQAVSPPLPDIVREVHLDTER